MDSEIIIGIVGGVGPYAGLDLQAKILAQTQADCDQQHLAVIALSQPGSIPDRTDFLLGRTPINPAYALADQLLRLAAAGATIAAIPCNTAHAPAIWDVLQAELRAAHCPLRVVHLIEVVAHSLLDSPRPPRRLGLLATTGTCLAQVYPQALTPLGFEVCTPSADAQARLVQPAIYAPDYGLKAQGRATPRARAALQRALADLRRQQVEAVILGCTELPLAFPGPTVDGLPVLDPTWLLAQALIQAVAPGKLKARA